MEKEPLISVIVPVYNVENYLKNCLESIINQTYKNIEILLIDDGSTDNSGEICNQISNQDVRIKVYHKRNGGLSSARNYGLKKAIGKYITFIDSDDDIEIDYIEYLYYLIKKYKVDMSVCAYKVIFGNKIINLGKNYLEKNLTKIECLSKLLCEKGITVSACAKLYKKSLFQGIKFPEGKLCEDNGTTYKLIDQCEFIAYGEKPKYNYYKRNNSIMTSNFKINKLDLIELSDEMCDYLEKYDELRDEVQKKRFHCRISILRQISESQNDKEYKPLINSLCQEIKNLGIKKNKCFNLRDKMAFYSLKLGYIPFKINWKIYNKLR